MKTITFSTLEQLIDKLEELSISELVQVHNDYCREAAYDNEFYDNDEDFFNLYFENNPYEVARSICYGNYRYMDEYVYFNGYGNLESANEYTIKDNISIEEIANYIFENPDEFDFVEFEELETV